MDKHVLCRNQGNVARLPIDSPHLRHQILFHTIFMSTAVLHYAVSCVRMRVQSDSKLLSGFKWPIIFKSYMPRKARILKLFSILEH
jgi:hypothetical protein